MKPYGHIKLSDTEMLERSRELLTQWNRRRSVRDFEPTPIPNDVLENIILTASTAPSGAHKQPWTYCVVTSSDIKKKIREAAEKEEYENYNGRMSESWLKDLAVFETNHIKEFLEIAPALIVVFKRVYEFDEDNSKTNNYYVNESVGLSVGMLIAAIHHAGLACLTHTPSPMKFLADILQRPENERAFLLIPVGHPANGAAVPDLKRKDLSEIMKRYD